jgi:serine/threonine protein phosphatase PrpC
MPSKSDNIIVAVFDGHGGAGAAIYAANNLIRVIESTEDWKMYLENGEESPKLVGDALTQAYFKIDEEIRVDQKSEEFRDSSGCTAVCAIITPKYIICANAGDSRCVVGSGGETIPLSEDHKPDGEIERARIENAGGWVDMTTKRVNGDLALSRALGDFSYKNRDDLPASQQKVSCEPDIRVHERTPGDDLLILACDGLWDVFTSMAGIEYAREILASGEMNPLFVAEELVDGALEKGIKH